MSSTWSVWSLFITPTVLQRCFPNKCYYKHFCSLIRILNLCLQFEVSKEINKIELGFRKWVVDWVVSSPFYFQKSKAGSDPHIQCYNPVLPPFFFFFSLPFFSHMTLCYLISHLTLVTWPDDHLTPLSHDLPYCSYRLLFYSPLSTIYGDPIVSGPIVSSPIVPLAIVLVSIVPRAPLFISLGHLVMVAASVVYKPSLYCRRGLKPDLVYQSKCCCSHQTCVLSPFSISLPFGLSQGPLRLSLQTPSSPQDVPLGKPLQSTTIVIKDASPLWSSVSLDHPCTLHLKAIGP